MSSATAGMQGEEDVEQLMQQVADAHSLEFKSRAADAAKHEVKQQEQQQVDVSDAEEGLEKRLAALRG